MDTTADFLTIIRNGYLAKLDTVSAPLARMKEEIAKILLAEGYIAGYTIEADGAFKKIVITLQYFDKGMPAVTGIKRISKPSVRIYSGHTSIPKALSGAGLTIVSTSTGLMSGKEAYKKHLGGEVICQVW